ncbi:hypothetical protein DXG01_006825 [Tephrocybe rancida]|nr:hypothetical protein DXG01_006825 [Tephrocybe rancida]
MSMQKPTLQNVRIRSVRDALQIFHGVATKCLPLITRRLDAEERRAIGSGNVYVWEERGANTEPTGLGMERWTDGMGWGPSRVRDVRNSFSLWFNVPTHSKPHHQEFLFYNQKNPNYGEGLVNPVTPWAQMMQRREQPMLHTSESAYMTIQRERLVKQTYSVHVTLPADSPRGVVRKWHLTAYFNQQRLDELGTIDGIRGVGDVPVPDGLFKSARAGKMRRDHRTPGKKAEQLSDGSGLPESSDSHSNHDHTPFQIPEHRDRGSPPLTYPTLPSRFSDNSRDSSPSSDGSRRWSPIQQASLVPLEYLQNMSVPRRDPADEQLLRRFSHQTISPTF